MSNNRIKGEINKAAGKAQAAYGNATNQSKQVAKGKTREAKGEVQSAIGKMGAKLK